MDGKVRIDGSINVCVMYLADDEESNIKSINTTLNFSQNVDFEEVREGMLLEDNISLKSIECRVINGRKVNIKAVLDLDLKISSNEDFNFVNKIEEVEDVQILDKTLTLSSLLGTGMTKVYAKDTIVIDSLDDLAEVMKVDFNILNKETKVSYNKVLVKADACVKIVYLTQDNRICTTTNLIPVMGFIDMIDVSDENVCDIKYEVRNLVIKPNSIEEHSIYVEAELEINAFVYQSKEIKLIQDLYSPSVNLVYNQKQIKVISQKESIRDVCSISEKQIIEEIGNNKVYDVDVRPTITNQTILNNRILYEGEVELNFLFAKSESNMVETKTLVVPFNFNMECKGANSSSQIDTNIEVILQDFALMPDETTNIKVDLAFNVSLSNYQSLQVIEEVNIDETRECKKYSLVIYFVKPGDTLWNIAKKFSSTVDAIAKINSIEDENMISVGEKLFIPTM